MPYSGCDLLSTVSPTDAELCEIFLRTRSIAVVGASPRVDRPSHEVADYLIRAGFAVHPVNPRHAGEMILGREVAGSLSELVASGVRIDMVDIFRRSAEAGAVVDEAIAALGGQAGVAIWMQIGVIDAAAAARARAAGFDVVMDRCPKIELPRLRRAGLLPSAEPAAQG
ncbi:CoA-binding protein [Paralimibaculum aggregatum]|uniref:CoA-binding protein n=1 Tax=Paralimibaculum aggregatum TaxID=3036245 RepID=UPI002554CEEC|nr:CoA-binding protein [Limibaculum sp. NKW23]